MAATALRRLDARDAVAAGSLLDQALGGSAYHARAREILEAALRDDPEWQARGSFSSDSLAGLVAFGPVSGAADVWRVGLLVFARDHTARESAEALIADTVSAVSGGGARLLVAELPADDAIGFPLATLRANGFREEARIPDFYRTGVAQLFLRREVRSGPAR